MVRRFSILIGILAFLVSNGLAAQKVTITYQTWTTSETRAETELIKEFEKANPSIKVNVEFVPFEQHFNKLYIAAKAGKTPDVIVDTPEWVWDLASRGVTRSLDEFIRAEGSEYVAQYIPIAWEFGLYHGEQHAIPWRVGGSGTYYNPEHFAEAGIEPPVSWNWDDLVTIAKKLTIPGVRYGYGFTASNDIVQPTLWHFANFLLQNGGRMVRGNKAAFADSRGVEALQFMVDLIYTHKVVPPTVSSWVYKDLFDAFATGKISMFTDGPWWAATMKTAYPNLKMGVTYNPIQRASGSPVGGTMLAMGKSTRNPREAWRFIKFMTSAKSLSKWAQDGGFIPPSLTVMSEKWMQEPDIHPFVVQLQAPNNQVLGNFPNYSDLRDSLQAELQQALLRQKSPKEALEKAAEHWNEVLAKSSK